MWQMAWLYGRSPAFRILHLNVGGSGWRPYTHFRQYSVPDYKEKGGSSGWATYQKLRQDGWELVETAVAEEMRNLSLTVVGDGGRSDDSKE